MVCMDDDGQHPAEGIFRLADKMQEDYDVVYAALLHKKHSLFKRVLSQMHNKLGEWLGNRPRGIRISFFFVINCLMVEELKKQNPFPSNASYLLRLTTRHANVEITIYSGR